MTRFTVLLEEAHATARELGELAAELGAALQLLNLGHAAVADQRLGELVDRLREATTDVEKLRRGMVDFIPS